MPGPFWPLIRFIGNAAKARNQMLGKLAKPWSESRCQHCDGPLVTHRERQEGFCSKLSCRGPCFKAMASIAREAVRKRREARDKFALNVAKLLKSELDAGAFSGDKLLIVVPSLQAEITQLSSEQIGKFQNHLQHVVAEASEQIEDENNRNTIRDTLYFMDKSNTSLAIINACTTCRGACCMQGAGHAFLRSEEIAKRFLDEPELTPESVMDQYLSFIPEFSYEGSCVYHGAEGCILPRQIRSSTCNQFQCVGIVDALPAISDSPSTATLVAATIGDICTRAALMQPDGTRQEFSIEQNIIDV